KPCRAPKELVHITTWADFSHTCDTGWGELMVAFERAGLTPPTSRPATAAAASPHQQQFPPPSRLDAWDRWLNAPVALKRLLALALLVFLVLGSVKVLTIPPPARPPTPKVFQGHIREFQLQNTVPRPSTLGGLRGIPMALCGFSRESPLSK